MQKIQLFRALGAKYLTKSNFIQQNRLGLPSREIHEILQPGPLKVHHLHLQGSLPDSKPLNLLDGINTLFVILESSPVIEFTALA